MPYPRQDACLGAGRERLDSRASPRSDVVLHVRGAQHRHVDRLRAGRPSTASAQPAHQPAGVQPAASAGHAAADTRNPAAARRHDRAVGDVLHRRDAAGSPPHPDGGLHLHARRNGPGTAAVRRHRPTAAGHSGGGPHPFRAQPADAGRGRDDGGQRVHPPPVEAAHPSDRLCVHNHGCDVQR